MPTNHHCIEELIRCPDTTTGKPLKSMTKVKRGSAGYIKKRKMCLYLLERGIKTVTSKIHLLDNYTFVGNLQHLPE